jgi:TRAP-type C4-dicarboxylate transport system permease small subunit
MLFTVASIILRFFHNSIAGSVEIVVNMNVIVAWMGFGLCALNDGHIKVDIFKRGPFFDRCWGIITIAGLIFFGIKTLDQAALALALNTTTGIIHFIKWPFYYVVALGFFAMALGLFYNELNYYVNLIRVKRGLEPRDYKVRTVAEDAA